MSSLHVNESRTCLFCGVSSKNKRKVNVCDTYQSTSKSNLDKTIEKLYKRNRHLSIPSLMTQVQCSVCSGMTCLECAAAICKEMEKSKIEEGDNWYFHMKNVLCSGKVPPPDFVGHCCEVRKKIEESRQADPHITSVSSLKFDGYLHLPQLHVLVPPPMDRFVDIHGFGAESEMDTPGLIHAVVNRETARLCYIHNVVPNGRNCKGCFSECVTLKIVDIYGRKLELKCIIETYYIDLHVNHHKLKQNDVSHSNLSACKVLDAPKTDTIWVIIAKLSPYSKCAHLVNVRFPVDVDLSDHCKKSLFEDSVSYLRRDGMDITRKGGSNGNPTFNNYDILSLLKSNQTFIRKGKGVKVVRAAKKWHCLYISAGGKTKSKHCFDRQVTQWVHVQPQLAGQFDMNDVFFRKYSSVVKAMTEVKYNSALLLVEISNYLDIKIQNGAVTAALEDLNACNNFLKHVKNICEFESKLVKTLTYGNKFSLVAYPVSYHFDTFIDGCMSLENKICFGFNITDGSNNIGRGGGGKSKFVFALLDHSDSRYRRRRQQYVAAGGDLEHGQRLTQEMWVNRFGTLDGYLIQNNN